jgi:hypothetical protein
MEERAAKRGPFVVEGDATEVDQELHVADGDNRGVDR